MLHLLVNNLEELTLKGYVQTLLIYSILFINKIIAFFIICDSVISTVNTVNIAYHVNRRQSLLFCKTSLPALTVIPLKMHPYFTISAFLMKVSTNFLEILTMKIRRENDSLLH
jgi:hypothetical protein